MRYIKLKQNVENKMIDGRSCNENTMKKKTSVCKRSQVFKFECVEM